MAVPDMGGVEMSDPKPPFDGPHDATWIPYEKDEEDPLDPPVAPIFAALLVAFAFIAAMAWCLLSL